MVRRYADDTTIREQSCMTWVLDEAAMCLCLLFDEHESLLVSDLVRHVVLMCRQLVVCCTARFQSLSHIVAFLLQVCVQHVSFLRLLIHPRHHRKTLDAKLPSVHQH